MKIQLIKLLSLCMLVTIAGISKGQTVLLSEDFSAGSMPAGWSQDSAGTTPFFTWAFDNPGGKPLSGAAFDASFVIFDSDFYGDSMSENAYLNMPVVNASAVTSLYLVMDEQYRDYDSIDYHQIEISVNGGLSWTGILPDTGTLDVGFPVAVHSIYDISSLAAGHSSVSIRFHYVAVWGYFWAIDNVTLVDSLPPPPANDECANAISLTMSTTCTPVSFQMGSATSSGNPGCNGGFADDDVWFSFMATDISAVVRLISPTGANHTVEVYDGCGGTSINCAELGSSTVIASLSGFTIGNTYYISVYTTDAGVHDITNQEICITPPVAVPSNDECGTPVLLTVLNTCVPTSGTLSGATDSGTPGCSGVPDDDVWYTFVANDTVVAIKVEGHGQDNPVIEVFDLCGGNSIACFNASMGPDERGLVSPLISGNTYYFRVYSTDATLLDSSDFDVCVTNVVIPTNDDCANAIQITPVADESACNLNTFVVTDFATASAPAPSCSNLHYTDDVWYYFVATNDTMTVTAFNLSADIASTGVGYTLYDSSCSGTEVACMNVTGNILPLENLTIGRTYFLRTFTANDVFTGSYNLCVFGGLLTGIPADNSAAELTLFPDPSSGVLNISVPVSSENAAVKIYDVIGNLMKEELIHSSRMLTVDLSSFANGVYIIRIENEKSLLTRKFILNK